MHGSKPDIEDTFRGCYTGLSRNETKTLAGLAKLDRALGARDPGHTS